VLRPLSLLLLLGLAGCGLGAGLDPLAGTDSGVQESVWIDAVDPTWGPIEGGTSVRILGGGFEGEVSVLFGGASVTVTVIDDGELVVTSPSTAVETAVDLTVRSDRGEAVRVDGFTYTDGEAPADGGSSDGGSGDGGGDGGDGGADGGGGGDGGGGSSGMTSGLVEFYYEVTACPSCFGLTEQLAIGAYATFHSPVSGSWTGWMPARGSCSTSATPTPPTSSSEDVGEWAYLVSGSVSNGLRRSTASGRTTYEAVGLSSGDYLRNASWDLSVSGGGSWGPFSLTSVVNTREGFTDIQPAAIMGDGRDSFTAQIQASNATFTWSPSGISDSFIVAIDVYNASGTSYLGGVFCHATDTGALTVPSSGLSGYPSGALLAIRMYRYQIEEAVHPVDGSTVQGVSSFGLIGTGVLR